MYENDTSQSEKSDRILCIEPQNVKSSQHVIKTQNVNSSAHVKQPQNVEVWHKL